MSTDTQFDGPAFTARVAEYDALFIVQTTQLILAKNSSELIEALDEQTGFKYDQDNAYAAAFGNLSERARVLMHRLAAAEARVAELEAEHACQHGTTCIGPECDRA